jgi:formiminoglutamate deiminase
VDEFARLVEASRKAIAALPDANLGVSPHSLRAVTPDELAQIVPLAAGGPVHIHAAEQTKEVDDSVAWSGARPVQWLLEHAPVDDRWCLVHATHMTEAETRGMAERGAVAGLCPITEGNLGDGIFPAETYLKSGGAFGIGTDSNVRIDPAEELRLLEYAQRLSRRARNLWPRHEGQSTGRALFDGALVGGAKALGQSQAGFRVGASADIVTLDAADPALTGRKGDALLDSWIFAGARIDGVWRHGIKVVSAGQHRARETIAVRYRDCLSRLIA